MKVRAQPDHLGESVDLDGLRSVVIRDDYGNPLILAQTLEEGVVVIFTHRDAGFRSALSLLGIGLNTKYVEGKPHAHVK